MELDSKIAELDLDSLETVAGGGGDYGGLKACRGYGQMNAGMFVSQGDDYWDMAARDWNSHPHHQSPYGTELSSEDWNCW